MYNTKQFLLHAIDVITKDQKRKGNIVSEEQIAEDANIPQDTFKGYLTGALPLPDNFVVDLMSKYGMHFGRIHHVVELPIRDSDNSENEEEDDDEKP